MLSKVCQLRAVGDWAEICAVRMRAASILLLIIGTVLWWLEVSGWLIDRCVHLGATPPGPLGHHPQVWGGNCNMPLLREISNVPFDQVRDRFLFIQGEGRRNCFSPFNIRGL